MNDEYNPLSFKSNEELVEASIVQRRHHKNYFRNELSKELQGNAEPKYSRMFNELNNLHQLFPPAFFTKSEEIIYEILQSAVKDLTDGSEPQNISMRLKLEHIN